MGMALLGLAGCGLIDQRTFDPQAGIKPVPPKPVLAPLPPGAPPLVTIDFTRGAPPYQEAVANALRMALARRSDAIFTVETLVPVTGSPEAQADEARAGAATARQVAEIIVGAGADPGQIELTVRADPARHTERVLVRVH